jgi:hypothetical protein
MRSTRKRNNRESPDQVHEAEPAQDASKYSFCLVPAIGFGSAAMSNGMARSAQGNQVLFRIIARVTTKLFVVDFQVRHRAA